MVTALQATGTPGGLRSFAPKNSGGTRGEQQFTALSVLGVPGPLRTFDAKSLATVQITDLTVWGIPGGLRFFEAKAPAPVVPPTPTVAPVRRGGIHSRIMADDEEVMAVILAAAQRLGL